MKYMNFEGMSYFLSKLASRFSPLAHTHKKSEITDLTIDSALSSTSTNPVQNKVVNSALSGKVPTSRTVNGKALSANISLSAADVGADASGTAVTQATSALNNAKTYTNTAIAGLVDNAPDGYDTLGGLASAVQANASTMSSMQTTLGNKVDKVNGKGLSTNDYTTTEKNKLAGIATGAEVNQNAFSNITVGTTNIAADSKTDTFTIEAGSNITLTPDTTNDKVTISAKDTVYTHPTYTAKSAGLYKVTVDGTGHVSATTAVTKSDITGLGIPAQDTTYSAATTSTAGLMSASDKSKLDGIASGANKITVDSSLSATSTNPVQNKAVNTALDTKVPTSRTINGKALSANITLSASDVGADASGTATSKANAALASAKTYTDEKVAALVDSAPETLDTLAEVATAIQENDTVVEALNAAIGNKVDKVSGKGLSTNDYTTTEKNKLSGIASGAEVNQNAFSTITVGTTAIAADSKTDTFTIVAGDNITLTPDTTNDKMTIAAKDTVYTHPTYTARTGVPTANATPVFGGTFTVSQPVSDGTGHITAINSRTITIPSATATTSAAGLMSSSDKSKLDGIATGANKTTVDSSMSTSSTNPVQNKVVQAAITAVSDTATANYNKSITGLSVSGKTVTYTKGDGTTGTITTQDTNTDTNVTQTVTTSNASYPLLLAPSGQTATKTTTAYFDSGVTLNPSTNTIAANISGNAATATSATKDSSGHTISSYYLKRGSLQRIEGTSTAYEDLNNYITAGFYNVRTQYVNNCPSDIDVSAVLLVYEWNSTGYVCQEITETGSSINNRRWIRHLKDTTNAWTSWSQVAFTTDNVASATKLQTARTIQLTGDVTGSATFNGTADASITATVADNSHNHNASNITAGTLGVARGGTGVTSNPSMLTNLGSTTAASVFAASPRPGVTGTLPIANGGTGATTAAAALANLGVTATAAELNVLDGVTATTTELNYVDGVTSNIQTQLNGKASASHGTHVTFSTTAPVVAGAAAVGTATTVSRSDHVHPAQTTVSGNAGSATKLATGRTLKVNLGSTSASTAFNGTANITDIGVSGALPVANGGTGATTAAAALANLGLTATAAELNKMDGVTATTAELNYVDGVTSNIQTQLNSKAASSHTHTAAAVGAAPTSHASTATTYGASSASNYGHAMASSTTPKANGTAAVGSETAKFARGDHVHPLQTTVSGSAGILSSLSLASSGAGGTGYWNPFTWTITSAWGGSSGIYAISDAESSFNGVFAVKIRTGKTADVISSPYVYWLSASGTPPTLTLTADADSTVPNSVWKLYITSPGTYKSYVIATIHDSANLAYRTTSRELLTSITGTVKYTASTALLTQFGITATASELNHMDGVTSNIQTQLNGKAATSHTHTNVNGVTPEWSGTLAYGDTSYVAAWTSDGKKIKATPKSSFAAASHGTHVSYSTTAPVMDGTASVGSASTVARSDHKHPTDTSRASASSVTTLQNLVGDTAVSAQISNYAAPKAHATSATTYGVSTASNYGHAKASATTPKAAGTASVGSETSSFARGDHVHPAQTTITGNAGTATKLATARNLTIGDATRSFNGDANVTWSWNDIGVQRSQRITNVGDDYTDWVLPLCKLTNSDISADFHFYGTLYLKRNNLLTWQLAKINILCGKNYNQALPRFSMNIEGGANQTICPVTFTYNSVQYFGLHFNITGSGYTGQNYITGYASDWDIIAAIKVYNNNTKTTLNTEVYNSLVKLEDNTYTLPKTMLNNVVPRTTETFSLGNSSQKWNEVYAKSFIGSGASLTSLNASNISSGTIAAARLPAASTSAQGAMTAAMVTKLNGIAEGANKYSLPTASSSTLGGVKTTSTVTSTSGLTACPIISGVPYYKDTNTTYSAATTSAAGLMSASDKSKLDGIASGANAYSLPAATTSARGGVVVGSNITVSSGTISVTKANVTAALGYTPPTTNTTYSNMTAATASAAGKAGLVPAPAAGKQTSFLRGDGTWVVPTNTTYSNFVKSGSGAAAGLVPAPSTTAGTTKYLREDGTWSVPPNTNTTYTGANGISLSGTTFSNSGVRSIATGTSNGTISVNTNGTTANVAVKGLGSAAYTASTAYAAASHTHNYLSASIFSLNGTTLTITTT